MSDVVESTGIIRLRHKGKDGKVTVTDYHTVAKRIDEFRKEHGDKYTIETQLITNDSERVVMKALILENDRPICDGYAEEMKGFGVNKGAALENCQTSAIGRALAFFGYGGVSIASVEEMQSQATEEELWAMRDLGIAIGRHWDTIQCVKNAIQENDLSTAVEAWSELTNEEIMEFWKAPSKGGAFSTHEVAVMKSPEWAEARKTYFEDKAE